MDSMYELLKNNRYFDYFQCKEAHDTEGLSRDELYAFYAERNKELEPYKVRYDNPYVNIQHFTEKMFNDFNLGDDIVIQEKVDGSNAHIRLTDSGFRCWGQNFELNEHNHLQGFWYWCRDHYTQIPEEYRGIDIYGEWLVPHHCIYRPECYGEFYVFDVMQDGKYWSAIDVAKLTARCGFSHVYTFVHDEFRGWASVFKYIGQSIMATDGGEGIVVKNQTTLNQQSKIFYVKLVAKEYQETNPSRKEIKLVDYDKITAMEFTRALAESVITKARVRKILYKLIDEDELSLSWTKLPFEQVHKIIKARVFQDCRKEVPKVVEQVGKVFGKYCNDFTFIHLKSLAEEVIV